MTPKALVIGGAGQAGSIHLENILKLAGEVGCYDFIENSKAHKNFSAKTATYEDALKDGYTHVVLALPDHILFKEGKKLLQAIRDLETSQVKAVLIEKPGSLNSDDLNHLVTDFEKASIPLFINYQRSFDPRVQQFTREVQAKVDAGFEVDHISIHSCDKAQPPQAAHQLLNQGCHDYALLLHILSSVGLNVDISSLTTHGAQWKDTDDTKFLRIGGVAKSEKRPNGTVIDVMMNRVSAKGTYTTMKADLSKHVETDSKFGMYEPQELQLNFPEKFDPNSSWADTWKDSFVQSMKSFLSVGTKSEESEARPVDAAFGVEVLKFAENALKALK